MSCSVLPDIYAAEALVGSVFDDLARGHIIYRNAVREAFRPGSTALVDADPWAVFRLREVSDEAIVDPPSHRATLAFAEAAATITGDAGTGATHRLACSEPARITDAASSGHGTMP